MKTVGLKAAISAVFPGATNIDVQCSYRYRSCWFDWNGETWNLFTNKVGWQRNNDVTYRVVEHRKDYYGGANQWGFLRTLEQLKMQLYVSIKNCDKM